MALDVIGKATFNDLVKIHGTLEMAEAVTPSDARMKKNVQPLTASLHKVSMLEGVSFNWKIEAYADRGFSDDKQIGLIAQQVEKVLPELVKTGTDGYKSVSYVKLTAVLVEAVKELKNENQALRTQIEEIKAHQAMLEMVLKKATYSSLSSSNSICMAGESAE
jgi:Chaperone of endosialidase